jgi:ACS family hexuronate transporter-like MFS transporter
MLSMNRFRWVVLGLATLMQLGMSLPQQTPAALGPILTTSLHLTGTELGLLTDAIWGGMLLGMLPSGLLADRFGERWTIAAGGAGLGLLMALASFTSSFWPLFLLLIPAAIAASTGAPGGTRALAIWFPPHERGMAMGVRQTGVTAAGVLTAVALPPIALVAGWQGAFRVVAVALVLTVAVFVACYREPDGARGVAMAPFRLLDLTRNRTFLLATCFGFVFMGALGAAVTYTAVALHRDAHISVLEAGVLLALLQVGGIAGRAGWGVVSDRVGTRAGVMTLCGALGIASTLGAAILIRPGTPTLVLGFLAFLLGLSTMGWNALYITLASEIEPTRAATVVGAGTMLNFLGMLVITPAFGTIADHVHSFSTAWLALAGWCALGTLAAAVIRDSRIGVAPQPSLEAPPVA